MLQELEFKTWLAEAQDGNDAPEPEIETDYVTITERSQLEDWLQKLQNANKMWDNEF